MSLRAKGTTARKAKTARPGPEAFSVREKTVGKYLFPVKDLEATVQVAFSFYTGKQANCFACVGILLLTPKNPGRKPGEFNWYAKKT